MRIATAEQMRTLDRRAIEERGIPSLELMERAANALAEAAIDTAANAPGRAVCFCGPGNNGGDGVACARLLLEAGLELSEVTTIVGAVGNHEEQNGKVVSAVSAALVIADKSDAHRTRVRRTPYNPDDIHDRVNYAISANAVEVDAQQRTIRFSIEMDDTSSVMDFMAIYLTRMQMCEEAAHFLGCRFELVVNGVHINRQGAPR